MARDETTLWHIYSSIEPFQIFPLAEYTEGILQANLLSGLDIMCTVCGTNTVTTENNACLPFGTGASHPVRSVTQQHAHIIK
jgi:hypothetical protein